MKKILLFCFLTLSLFLSSPSWARKTMSVSGFGGPQFQLTNTYPELGVGLGGGVAFDYRFNQRWAIASSISFFTQDGRGASSGDKDSLLINVPEISLKFYLLGTEHKIDPYLSAGIGLSILTEGSRSDNSGGAGIGAQFGVGTDFYFTDWFSVGFLAQFKTVGIIRDSSQSSALIFLSTLGNFTFHFK
ncbi:MAG: outer membrane beta-barrel protein [Deltaproteobacteria bacterium]|nr:outer membrane beta-barrel protein [Deltaproteobacteria bacterium]